MRAERRTGRHDDVNSGVSQFYKSVKERNSDVRFQASADVTMRSALFRSFAQRRAATNVRYVERLPMCAT